MAGLKLMINKDILDSTLVQNLNQGLGVPSYLEGTTIQKLLQPSVDLNNPASGVTDPLKPSMPALQ